MIEETVVRRVRVRDAKGCFLPLGDIGSGTDFAAWLAARMRGFESASTNKPVSVRCAEPVVDGDDTFLVLEHRQSGEAGDIFDGSGRLKAHLSPDDTRVTRYGALFRRFRTDDTGYLAAQASSGGEVETLLEQGIRARMAVDFPRLVLDILPFVPAPVLLRAVEEQAFKSARLVRYEQPADRAVAAVHRWVKSGTVGRLSPGLAVFGLVKRTRDLLPGQAARDEARASGEIVEFRGETTPIRLDIEEAGGTQRSYVVRRPGLSFIEEIELPAGEQVQSDASLLATLRHALRDVSG